MKRDSSLKTKAINLRGKGLSYNEIKKHVVVSKSTLSLWLRDVELGKEARIRLSRRSKLGQPYGARAQKRIRIARTKKIVGKAKKEIEGFKNQDLFYVGIALYWAEGAKQKEHNPSQIVAFSNSDPQMIKVYISWLVACLKVNSSDIHFQIYSHNNIKEKEADVVKYWSQVTDFSKNNFNQIYYKKDKKNNYRRNQGKSYCGLLRVSVKRSTDLNRRIAGLIKGIAEQCPMV